MYDLIFALNFAEKSLFVNKKGENPKAQQPKPERPFLASAFTFLLAFAFHACEREQLKRKHKCKVESAQL